MTDIHHNKTLNETLSQQQEYIAEFFELLEQVVEHRYYVDRLAAVLKAEHPDLCTRFLGFAERGEDMQPARTPPLDCQQACSLLNSFWCALPDSMSIHRPPFDRLCDLSETYPGAEEAWQATLWPPGGEHEF